MMNYEFDKNTGELRFGGRLIATIKTVDSRTENDLEDIFDFYNENQGFDFEQIRDLQDRADDLNKQIAKMEEENIDGDSQLFYDIRDLVEELSDLERW